MVSENFLVRCKFVMQSGMEIPSIQFKKPLPVAEYFFKDIWKAV